MDFSQYLRLALHSREGLLPFDMAAVERLEKAGAFAGRPALRFILTTALRGGALARFLEVGEWSDEAYAVVDRFVAHTGFVPDLVEGVFRACAEVAGWTPSAADRAPSGIEVAEPAAAYGMSGSAPGGCGELDSIRAVMTADREKEEARGVTVENFDAVSAAGAHIRCTATLRRLAPMGSGTLICSVTDAAGRLVYTANVFTLTVTSPSVMPVAFSIPRLVPAPASVVLRIG